MDYDLEYYERTLRLNSATAEKISRIRWAFVEPALRDRASRIVLDYGSGVGWFRAFRPEGVIVDSYDVGAGPRTGIRSAHYDLVCLWDVLEHVRDVGEVEPYLRECSAAAVTVPIRPTGVLREEWKHTKPGEHVREFTQASLREFMERQGLALRAMGWPECPPRQDIVSALFVREKS